MANIRYEDLTGKTFSRLTVISYHSIKTDRNGQKHRQWICKCMCGNYIFAITSSLNSGNTKCCGCYRKPKPIKHGRIHTTEYHSWAAIIQRCTNPKCHAFQAYGGNGILVCDEWKNSFDIFIADMGVKPTIEHSIERIDNSKGYYKNNCKWGTWKEQANNRSSTVFEIIDGIKMCRSDAIKYCNVDKSTFYRYINMGHTGQEIKNLFDKKVQSEWFIQRYRST